MTSRRWSDEDDQKAREMYADPSVTIEQIAKQFPDRTETAIRNHCAGVKRVGQWTHAKTEDLKLLAATGATSVVIAEKLGVTRNAIIGRCFRMGIRLGVNHALPFVGHRKMKGKAVRDAALARTEAVKAAAAASEPDTSDIPEAGGDWFRRARLVMPDEKNLVEPVTVESVGSMSPLAAALVRARPSQCRFPIKGGMCENKRTSLESSWCSEHEKVVFVPQRRA
jgi:hypothetical protein